eukprot:1966063-Amphidinium_carterae.1
MESSEADTRALTQGDVVGTSGESVVEPPAAKKVRRIELVHVPKRTFGLPPAQEQARGYGPSTPPDENSVVMSEQKEVLVTGTLYSLDGRESPLLRQVLLNSGLVSTSNLCLVLWLPTYTFPSEGGGLIEIHAHNDIVGFMELYQCKFSGACSNWMGATLWSKSGIGEESWYDRRLVGTR